MARKQKLSTPYQWKEYQLDPANIHTERVQFWRNGVMVTAEITRDKARELVSNRCAFVICEQAIGAIENDRPNS